MRDTLFNNTILISVEMIGQQKVSRFFNALIDAAHWVDCVIKVVIEFIPIYRWFKYIRPKLSRILKVLVLGGLTSFTSALWKDFLLIAFLTISSSSFQSPIQEESLSSSRKQSFEAIPIQVFMLIPTTEGLRDWMMTLHKYNGACLFAMRKNRLNLRYHLLLLNVSHPSSSQILWVGCTMPSACIC